MIAIVETLIHGVADTLFVFVALLLAKWVSDRSYLSAMRRSADGDSPELTVDHQIEERSNLAVALRRCGLGIGFGLGLAGIVSGGVTRFGAGWQAVLDSTLDMLGYFAVLLVFFFVAQLVAEHVILHHVRNTEELHKGNDGVGFAEFGILVATGLVAYGSFHGEGGGWHTSLAFFAMGQVALIVFAVLYEWVTPFNCLDEIRDGNAAAGLMLGGTLVTLGIILGFAISGPFTGWVEGIVGFAVSAAVGMALLIPFQWLIDKAFLPNTTLKIEVERDRNLAACSVTVAAQVALSIMIGALVA